MLQETALDALRLTASALLQGMGQLVGDQFTTFPALRPELAGAEENLVADGERARQEIENLAILVRAERTAAGELE